MMSVFARLVRHTPLIAAPELGDGVWLKLENLQRTGSFKLRGACVKLDALAAQERARGVVTASAGNHGLGLALAGRELGIRVEVFVGETVPAVKKNGIAALGAQVHVGGASYDAAEETARRRAEESGALFVSPFDDDLVIQGNGGTLGAEILADLPGVAQVVCPIGGGGLASGLARAGLQVAGVQPRANCAMHESLRLGRALTVYDGEPTLAEGCEGAVAERTFAVCRDRGVTIALVSEEAIRAAMAFAYRTLGQAIEPSAAVALAGVRARAVDARSDTVVVISGGNVEPDLLSDVLGR